MGRLIPAVLALALLIYAFITLIRCPEDLMRGRLPKFIWLLIIIFFPIIGPILWILMTWVTAKEQGIEPQELADKFHSTSVHTDASSPRQAVRDIIQQFNKGSRDTQAKRPTSPDDDPEFLWQIQREVYLEKQRRQRGKAEANNSVGSNNENNSDSAVNDRRDSGGNPTRSIRSIEPGESTELTSQTEPSSSTKPTESAESDESSGRSA